MTAIKTLHIIESSSKSIVVDYNQNFLEINPASHNHCLPGQPMGTIRNEIKRIQTIFVEDKLCIEGKGIGDKDVAITHAKTLFLKKYPLAEILFCEVDTRDACSILVEGYINFILTGDKQVNSVIEQVIDMKDNLLKQAEHHMGRLQEEVYTAERTSANLYNMGRELQVRIESFTGLSFWGKLWFVLKGEKL